MLTKILSILMLPFIFLGGDGTVDPVPIPEPVTKEVILYQTDELRVTGSEFTYATSVSFTYTITNKTDKTLRFSLPNTSMDDSASTSPFRCTLKAGATSKPLMYTQPESTYRSKLKFAISDYDEYNLAFSRVGKIVTIDLQLADGIPALADLIYNDDVRLYKADEALFIDNQTTYEVL